MASTITDLYASYDAHCGRETPIRTMSDLRALWHAAGCRYGSDADEAAFWTLVFGRHGDSDRWGDDEIDWPTDEQWAAFAAERAAMHAETGA